YGGVCFVGYLPGFTIHSIGIESRKQKDCRTPLVACRSEFVTTDAAGGVSVLPLDGASIGGVGVDVAAEFASQVGNRGEDAARDDLAFDLGEPDLDLVEPGRIGGGEVKPDSGMLLQEVPDGLSFVRRE